MYWRGSWITEGSSSCPEHETHFASYSYFVNEGFCYVSSWAWANFRVMPIPQVSLQYLKTVMQMHKAGQENLLDSFAGLFYLAP